MLFYSTVVVRGNLREQYLVENESGAEPNSEISPFLRAAPLVLNFFIHPLLLIIRSRDVGFRQVHSRRADVKSRGSSDECLMRNPLSPFAGLKRIDVADDLPRLRKAISRNPGIRGSPEIRERVYHFGLAAAAAERASERASGKTGRERKRDGSSKNQLGSPFPIRIWKLPGNG